MRLGRQHSRDWPNSKPCMARSRARKHRGPKVHHTALYPGGLLPGMVFCSLCGSRMWQEGSGKRHYLGCHNRGNDEHCCELTTRVPLEKAEKAVSEFVAKLLTTWPEWLNEALDFMRQHIAEVTQRVPDQIVDDERRLRELESQIANLVDALASGRIESQAVRDRLDEAERETKQLRAKLDGARKLLAAPVQLPDDAWIQQQLRDLASVIREGDYEASLLLRKIVGRIEADQVIPPGKSRGYARLRFRVLAWETLKEVLSAADSCDALNAVLTTCANDDSPEAFVIDLGGPTPMDHWAPKIAEMRSHGKTWREIAEFTGLDHSRAYLAWRRFVGAQEAGNVAGGKLTTESDDRTRGDQSDSDQAA